MQKANMKLMKNCRVYNSADIGSNHALLLSKIQLPIKIIKRRKPGNKRFAIDKLKEKDVTKAFEIKIGGRFEPLLDMNTDTDIEEMYNKFKNISNTTTKEVVGYQRRKNVEGMPKEVAELCEKRRKARKEFIKETKLVSKSKKVS